jgi:epoxide hydrolase 4
MTAIRSDLRVSRRAINGVTLNVAEAGPETGPLVILLHGFPEFWYGWRHQIDALVAAGFRVLVPDQRGYNLSDRPPGVASYHLDRLAADIVGLADALDRRRFAVVGHDWGGAVGWWLAARHGERIERLVALSAPHPAAWLRGMRDIPRQRRMSWYVAAFRIPWLPEFLLRQRRFKALADALCGTARADACTEADLDAYRAAWAMPGALTGMVNWYRALSRKDIDPDHPARVTVPTLILWGTRDKYGVRELAEVSVHLCDHGSIVYLDATHWVQHDEPERVSELLIDFLRPQG